MPEGAVRGVDGESTKTNARTWQRSKTRYRRGWGQPFSDKFLEAVGSVASN